MKKIVCFLMVGLLLFSCACSQGKTFPENINCEQILNSAIEAAGHHQNVTLYLESKNNLDTYTMSLWADGTYSECAEFDLVIDYALCYSSDNTTYEISVLKAKDKADAQKLTAVLERRKQTLSSGDKAAYDPDFNNLIENSRILTESEFVILLITPDNDAAITAIENLKQ